MKSAYFCGFNGFRQFGSAHGIRTAAPTVLSPEWSTADGSRRTFAWAFNAFTNGQEITISGFVGEAPNSQKVLSASGNVKSLASTDNFCLVLLENGDLYRINVRHNCVLEKVNFIAIEEQRASQKRSIFGETKDRNEADPVEMIACGRNICVAITRSNAVYSVPSKIFEFPKHVRIKRLACGFEHALALSSNGDVYSWGNGMRGQLGHAELRIEEIPVLIEALAGLKIIAISAGGWSSAAISSFGDLYVWGLNINGQLGIEVYRTISGENETISKRKNPTVYHLPQVIDTGPCCSTIDQPDENVENSCSCSEVICGARHTFIKKSCGKIFCCGWNEHGQLGLNIKDKFKDIFTEFKSTFPDDCDIFCGPWSTVFFSKEL